MELGDLITPEAVIPASKAKTKKQVLQEVAERAADLTGLRARDIFKTIFSVFARLEQPIDFDAGDGEPVDLIFLLLAPEHAGADHLKALARISRLLREPQTIERLRASHDRAALFSALTDPMVHAA
jgi:PTS system nitrogen regulatory IIA component